MNEIYSYLAPKDCQVGIITLIQEKLDTSVIISKESDGLVQFESY